MEREKPKFKYIRLKSGFTQGDLALLGDGDKLKGALRLLEEMTKLSASGDLTEDSRPLGDEIDLLRQNPIPPASDSSVN